MNVFLFAGAGTSIELGVPAMLGMGEEFLAHANQWDVEPELTTKLMGGSLDVEHLIEALDRICSARDSLEAIGEVNDSHHRINKIRAEVEWFVQHAAERVVAGDARLMWGGVLRASPSIDLTIVTTNYDRAIELAANAEKVTIDDGFALFDHSETSSWIGFGERPAVPKLVKLHGSTDWYAAGEFGKPTKLRHPMPLFGRATLKIATGVELGSALVLPSREKLLTHSPYPRLSQTFLNAADGCDFAVFVGSSLRDHHIRGAVESISGRAPVFLVNPSGDKYDMENVHVIKQRASSFLISTLPSVLAEASPADALLSASELTSDDSGTLQAVRVAMDTDAHSASRCNAIDKLDEIGLTLDSALLEGLLDDQDAAVARYALGLISMSPNVSALIDHATASTHAADFAFSQDLQLLREMIL